MNNTRLDDMITIWVVYLPERTETGGPYYRIGPTVQTGAIDDLMSFLYVFLYHFTFLISLSIL